MNLKLSSNDINKCILTRHIITFRAGLLYQVDFIYLKREKDRFTVPKPTDCPMEAAF